MILRVFYVHRTLVGHSFHAEDPTSITRADAPARQSVASDGVTNRPDAVIGQALSQGCAGDSAQHRLQ
jgi:hypothetical protein